jgi:hypothetical protein
VDSAAVCHVQCVQSVRVALSKGMQAQAAAREQFWVTSVGQKLLGPLVLRLH